MTIIPLFDVRKLLQFCILFILKIDPFILTYEKKLHKLNSFWMFDDLKGLFMKWWQAELAKIYERFKIPNVKPKNWLTVICENWGLTAEKEVDIFSCNVCCESHNLFDYCQSKKLHQGVCQPKKVKVQSEAVQGQG